MVLHELQEFMSALVEWTKIWSIETDLIPTGIQMTNFADMATVHRDIVLDGMRIVLDGARIV